MTTPPAVYDISFRTSAITEAQLKAILDTLDTNSFILLAISKV